VGNRQSPSTISGFFRVSREVNREIFGLFDLKSDWIFLIKPVTIESAFHEWIPPGNGIKMPPWRLKRAEIRLVPCDGPPGEATENARCETHGGDLRTAGLWMKGGQWKGGIPVASCDAVKK
jgi:hypothetical protein